MNKNWWIICILIFAFITVFVLSLDGTAPSGRVKISNRNIEISHESTEVVNDDSVKLKLGDAKIDNKKLETQNKNINIDSSSNINNSEVSFNNSETEYSNQSSNFKSGSNKFSNNNNITYKNLDTNELDIALNEAKNINNKRINPEPRPIERKYKYKNIDWGTWKSNFVNQILEDSLKIHELDEYQEGSWFYYSFDVDLTGKISNIQIKSIFLTPEDKTKVAKLIKSYQYQDITLFPANTKRKSATVSAVMMLSDTTKKTNPNDFKDIEHVKFQY